MILRCDSFCEKLNARFHEHSLPIHIRNFSNVFTIQYLSNSLYNSRYTQYLMAEGIYLQTDPTSKGFRFHLNADATENCLSDLTDKFVSAGITMKSDGYFETFTFCAMVQLSFYLSCRCFFNWISRYYNQIMTDKNIEKLKFGHKDRSKKEAVVCLLFSYLLYSF